MYVLNLKSIGLQMYELLHFEKTDKQTDRDRQTDRQTETYTPPLYKGGGGVKKDAVQVWNRLDCFGKATVSWTEIY